MCVVTMTGVPNTAGIFGKEEKDGWHKFDKTDTSTWPKEGSYWVAVRFYSFTNAEIIEYVDRMKFFPYSDDSDSDLGWQGSDHGNDVIGWTECDVPDFPERLVKEGKIKGEENA